MAEEQQPAPTALAAYPAPPFFWQSFTPENLERISSLRSTQPQSSSSNCASSNTHSLRLLDLPPELRNLQAPEPPQDGVYRCFGEIIRLEDPILDLKEQGFEQLYTPPRTPSPSSPSQAPRNREFILKRLSKSLLLNFLEMLGILSINPEHGWKKAEDIKTIFINIHHLLNEYRPHQARESLILMMQDQLERSRNETRGIREMKEKVEVMLESLKMAKLVDGEMDVVREEVEEEGRDVWEVLEREFG